MRRLIAPALLAASLPLGASAQDRVTLLDLISIDRIVQQVLQSGVMMLRTQVDMQYSDMSVDILTGKVTITDVQAWPLPDWDEEGTCAIGIDRLTVRGGALDVPDQLRFKLQASGVSFPASCVPRDPREALAIAGLNEVTIPRVTMDVEYGLPSSDAQIRFYADVQDVGVLDAQADFAYLWFDGRDDMEEPIPVMFLESATLEIENRGIWQKLSPMVPAMFTDANAGQVVQGVVSDGLRDGNRGDDLNAAQEQFVASLAAAWPAFLSNPERLVIETKIDGDAFLDFEAMEDELTVVFDTLQPRVSLAPSTRAEMLPAGLVKAVMEGDPTVAPEDVKRVAIAMVTGVGAPKQTNTGTTILRGLALEGDGQVAMILAEAQTDSNPEAAYLSALAAGRSGESGATALLDRLEKRIGFARVVEIQDSMSKSDTHSSDSLASVSLLREEAIKRFSGRGQARSYEIAAMWAMLAAAAGDAEARDILDDIAERARLGGAEATAAWVAAEARASEQATLVWVRNDLPAKFSQ